MIRKLQQKINDESGAVVIVEATFVFPIMFFVIFFLIFMGNMYVSKSYVDTVVNEAAVKYAARCADPNLETIAAKDGVTDVIMKNEPYRYIFTGSIKNVETACANEIKSKGANFFSFFDGMGPSLKNVKVKFNNNIVNYSLSVTAQYTISMPIKFIFQDDIKIYNFSTHAEVAVTDAPEFIRNIDMVVDYIQQSEMIDKAREKLSALFDRGSVKKLNK